MRAERDTRRTAWLGALRRLLQLCGVLVLFLSALAVGLPLHLNLEASRRLVARSVDALLASLLYGRVRITSLDELRLDRVVVAAADILDREGRTVLSARGLRVRARGWTELLPWALGMRDAHIRFDQTQLDDVELLLVPTEDGELSLAEALRPRERPPTPPPDPAKPPTLPKRLVLSWPRFEIGQLRIRGAAPGGVGIDGELRRVSGSLSVGTDGVLALDVSRAGVRERAVLGRDVAGSLAYHLRTVPLRMWGDFAGDVSGLEVVATGKLTGSRLEAMVDLPRVDPADLEPWVSGLPLRHPFVGRLIVAGTPPRFDVAAKLAFPRLPDGLGRGQLSAKGTLSLEGDPSLDVGLEASGVDTRMFADQPVWASIGGVAALHVRAAGADTEMRAQFQLDGPTSLGERLPRTGGTVVLDSHHVALWLRLEEPSTPADLFAHYGTHGTLRTSVALDATRLDRRTRLGDLLARALGSTGMGGAGRLRARASLTDDRVDADFGVELRSFAWPESGIGVAAVEVGGTLSGPYDALEVDASARGHHLTVAGRVLESFGLFARGPISEPSLKLRATDDDRRTIDAHALVGTTTGAARQVRVRVARDGAELGARLASVRPTAAGFALEGLELDGLGGGGVRGQLSVRDGELSGSLQGSNVELEPIRKLLGVPFPVRGRADVDIEMKGQGRNREGHVRLALHDGGVLVVDGIQASLDAAVRGAELRADARVALTAPGEAPAAGSSDAGATPPPGAEPPPPLAPPGAAATVDPCAGTFAAVEVVGAMALLDGPLVAPETYRRATGTFPVRLPNLRLSCIAQTLAQVFYTGQAAPIEKLDGMANVSFDIALERDVAWPSIRGLKVATRGLQIVAQRPEPDADPPWSSERIDVNVEGAFDARAMRAKADVVVRDGAKLAEVSATALLPIDALLAGDFDGAWERVRQSPASLRLEVPRRAVRGLASIPAPLRDRVPDIEGEVQLLAALTGSLADPTASVRLRGWGVGLPSRRQELGGVAPAWLLPLDVDSLVTYGRASTGVQATIGAEGSTLATLRAGLLADLPAAAQARAWPSDGWSGSVALHLEELPLDSLAALASRSVSGRLSGDVNITDLGRSPKLEVDLATGPLRFGQDATFERARLLIRPAPDFGAGTLVADAELRATGGGSLSGTAYGGVAWERGVRPRLDRDAPADLLVRARSLPLGAFHPLVSPAVSKLEGQLDGDLRLQWHQVAAQSDADLSVDMQLRRGVVHIPQIGQELRGLKAHVTGASGGIVRVDDVEAFGTSGRVSGSARVRLEDLGFRDLMAELVVAEGEEVPVTFEGVPLGTASGRFIVHAVKQPDEVELNLTGQSLRLTLPAGASQSVQPLADNPDVQVSHPLERPRTKRSKADLRWVVTLGLLDSEIRGSGLRLLLSSNPKLPPTVTVGHEVLVGGELVLQSGEFDFLGLGSGPRAFVLDRGLVRFRSEDPGNPYVNLAAHHDASDGSTITLEYVGLLKPIDRDKIRFRSIPPRTEQEIIALLLFGDAAAASTAASTGTEQASRDSGAAGGGSIAAYQLNALLGGISPLRGLSTTFGVTDEGYTSTGVAYQISDTVSAQAAFERRDQSANSGTTDTTAEGRDGSLSRTRVGVDWRFYEDFLLRGSIGIGDEPTSGLDLMWQYRY